MTKTTQPKMTEHTLLEALHHAMRETARKGDGKSAAELATESNMHITKVRHQLRILLDQGKCAVKLEFRSTIAGYMRPVPVYYLKR